MGLMRFDEFSFDSDQQKLLKDGQEIILRPKAARLLALFLNSNGKVLSKSVLIEEVWGEEINEQVLFQTISELRKALGDSSRNPRFINNLKKRGYCWIGSPGLEAKQPTPKKRPYHWITLITALVGAAATVTYLSQNKSVAPSQAVRIAIITGDQNTIPVDGLLNMVATAVNSQEGIEVMPAKDVKPFAEEFSMLHEDPARVAHLLVKLLGLDYVMFCELSKDDTSFTLVHTMYSVDGLVHEGSIQQAGMAQAAGPLGEQLLYFFKAVNRYEALGGPFSKNPHVLSAYAAGEQAMEMANFKLARDQFLRCQQLEPQFKWARVRLARCLEELGELSEAAAINRDVIADLDESTDPELRWLTLKNMASLAMRRADYEEALKFRNRILKQLSRKHHPVRYAKTLLALGVTNLEMGQDEEAQKYFLECLTIFRDEGYHLGLAHAYNNLGVIYHQRDRYEEALEFLKLALEIYQHMGSKWYSAMAMANLGNLSYKLGDFEQQRSYEKRAAQLAHESGNRRSLAVSFNSYGLTEEKKGNYSEAIQYFQSGYDLYTENTRDDVLNTLTFNLSRLYLQESKFEKAHDFIQRFGQLTQHQDEGYYILLVHHALRQKDCEKGREALSALGKLTPDRRTSNISALEVQFKTICENGSGK